MLIISKRKTVYYPGHTMIKYCPELVNNWKTILYDLGIKFDLIEDIHSGWPLWNQGFEEFEDYIKELKIKLQKQGIKKIITSSPEAKYIFNKYLGIKVIHTTELVYDNIQKIQQYHDYEIAWHDNTTQVRRNNIINQPRRILEVAGLKIKEFEENKHNTQCLGTSTGLVNNSPRIADKLALRRIRMSPANIIVTDSTEDYLQLRKNGAKVQEISELLVEI